MSWHILSSYIYYRGGAKGNEDIQGKNEDRLEKISSMKGI